jgi:alkaline phosphatase D
LLPGESVTAVEGPVEGGSRRFAPPGQANLPPSAGLQFFGQIDIDHGSRDLTVSLKDLTGATLFSQRLRPRHGDH